jgi:hypothetical protein
MDTLAATQALKGKGYSRDQAEALVGLLHATISSDLVTKAELAASEARLADRIERAQATIERSLAVLVEKMGAVEARLSQRLTEELRSVDERVGKEAGVLD